VSVGRDTIGLRADYVLKSELREFQAAYDDALGKVLRRLVEWSLTEAARIDKQGPRSAS
jgi:cholesterol transport system auxiliary component